jgi:hypothetical protein
MSFSMSNINVEFASEFKIQLMKTQRSHFRLFRWLSQSVKKLIAFVSENSYIIKGNFLTNTFLIFQKEFTVISGSTNGVWTGISLLKVSVKFTLEKEILLKSIFYVSWKMWSFVSL